MMAKRHGCGRRAKIILSPTIGRASNAKSSAFKLPSATSWSSHPGQFVAPDKGNLFAGICLTAFGIYLVSIASGLPYVSEVGPGPGFFPLWIGIGLITFASYLSIASFVSSWNVSKAESQSWSAAGRVLAGWLAML